MADAPTSKPEKEYEGEPNPPGFTPVLGRTGITLVIGGNLNPFGHAMFRMGGDGAWIHVHKPYEFPDIIPTRAEFSRYLRVNRKNVYSDIDVRLPYPQAALAKIQELRMAKWPWLGIPHNCVNFCEQIIQAGGADWSSVTNLPYLITFLNPWITEDPPKNFQASVQIEGPRKLRFGESAKYRVNLINLPGLGNLRWWPKVGLEHNGLKGIQIGFGEITVQATEKTGKSAVIVKYVAGEKSWAGQLEVEHFA